MKRDDRYQDGLSGGRDVGLDGWAAGRHQLQAPSPGAGAGERPGLGGLWLLLAPVACCGGPFLIAVLAAAGALAWAGLGLAAAVLVAALVALVLIRRRRRSRVCCAPGAASWPGGAGASARRPAAR